MKIKLIKKTIVQTIINTRSTPVFIKHAYTTIPLFENQLKLYVVPLHFIRVIMIRLPIHLIYRSHQYQKQLQFVVCHALPVEDHLM